jgi:hypothetical protein
MMKRSRSCRPSGADLTDAIVYKPWLLPSYGAIRNRVTCVKATRYRAVVYYARCTRNRKALSGGLTHLTLPLMIHQGIVAA